MTTFSLHITCDNTDEFETLVARFLGSSHNEPRNADDATMPEIGTTAKRGSRKPKADTTVPAPTQSPDGTPIAPVHTPEPQPTPGGTDAPPAESIPPNQAAAGADASTSPAAGSSVSTETVTPTPAAGSPADMAAAAAGEVTVQQLKDAMADLLKAKSASFAMQTLEAATGCKSLTTGSPSVVEKSKTDPAIMQRTLDALVAAKA